LVVGDDFVFGRRGQGNYALLEKLGEKHHFEVAKTSSICLKGVRVSSTIIREALRIGDFQLAEKFLGKPYAVSGRVAYGNQLGHKLGYPTANIYLHQRVIPIKGVFGVKIWGLDTEPLHGVANIGTRPTLLRDQTSATLSKANATEGRPVRDQTSATPSKVNATEGRPVLEVHIFKFNQNIYGRRVSIEFLYKIRDEIKFASLEALREQIALDIRIAIHC
jgi:riboflavin kinase/FMN adenylyltransferase